ncbi:MAG: phospholipase D family protein [Bryobacterales bacterium]|nr:phospholipase D family protein [Bryobacterales bacterium]
MLKSRFEVRLAGSDRVDIATAWATWSPALGRLCEAAAIKDVQVRAIVGLYGNATSLDALERLQNVGNLRLIECQQSIFHPKVYIFRGKSGDWAWIGSANFTGAGFTRNDEAVYETNDVTEVVKWFNRRWDKCGALTSIAIDQYRERRRKQGVSRHLVGLVGRPQLDLQQRLAYLSDADCWSAYLRALDRCNESWLDEGLGWSVLGESRSYFDTIQRVETIAQCENWIGLSTARIRMLLGLRDDHAGAWGLLGSLEGAGRAKRTFMNSEQEECARVLTRLRGAMAPVIEASEWDFPDVAVTVLEEVCPKDGKGLEGFGHGVVTRLLALARPDRLVSVNEGSRHGLSKLFDLPRSTLGTPGNYGRLLERLYELPWYRDRPGRSKREKEVWRMRAALIDSFVYKHPSPE